MPRLAKKPATQSQPKRPRKPNNSVELLNLGAGLVKGSLVRRPSLRNRSPWVADVKLSSGRIVLAHMPALDMGGKCVPGSVVLLKKATDSKGRPIGAKAVGPYGTPKCEFIVQLVRVLEPENKSIGGCWVAAHPNLGEKLAAAFIERGLIQELSSVTSLHREVSAIEGFNLGMRADFVSNNSNGSKSVVEVKTVMDTDHNPATPPAQIAKELIWFGRDKPYCRSAVFPWGSRNQIGPQGEQVVSSRAIKHIDALGTIASGAKKVGRAALNAVLVFVVPRHDVKSLRVNSEACPSFARHITAAKNKGLRIVAYAVRWGEGQQLGKAFSAGPLPVDIPLISATNVDSTGKKRRQETLQTNSKRSRVQK